MELVVDVLLNAQAEYVECPKRISLENSYATGWEIS